MTHAQGSPQGPARTRMRTRTWLEPLASCLRPSVLVDELGSEHVRLRVLGEQYLIQVLHWSHGVRSAEVRWAESHPAPGSLRSSRTDPSCEALLPTTGTVGTEGQHMVRSETGRGPAGLQESPTRTPPAPTMVLPAQGCTCRQGTRCCTASTSLRGQIWNERRWPRNPENEKPPANAEWPTGGHVQGSSSKGSGKRGQAPAQAGSRAAMLSMLQFLRADTARAPTGKYGARRQAKRCAGKG